VPNVSACPTEQRAHVARQALEQGLGDRLVREHARGRRALLPGVDEGRVDHRGHDVVEVGVRVDDHAVLAAHLGDDALEMALAGRTFAALSMMLSPTAPDPVNAIVATSRCSTSAAPTSPSPGSSASAPAGTPASRSARTIS
jgi:hypothetical protein